MAWEPLVKQSVFSKYHSIKDLFDINDTPNENRIVFVRGIMYCLYYEGSAFFEKICHMSAINNV